MNLHHEDHHETIARLREEMHEARVTLAGLAEREYAAKLAHDRLGNALKENLQDLTRVNLENARLRESETELHRIRQGLILDNDRLREENKQLREWSEGDWWDELTRLREAQHRLLKQGENKSEEILRLREADRVHHDDLARVNQENASLREEVRLRRAHFPCPLSSSFEETT